MSDQATTDTETVDPPPEYPEDVHWYRRSNGQEFVVTPDTEEDKRLATDGEFLRIDGPEGDVIEEEEEGAEEAPAAEAAPKPTAAAKAPAAKAAPKETKEA